MRTTGALAALAGGVLVAGLLTVATRSGGDEARPAASAPPATAAPAPSATPPPVVATPTPAPAPSPPAEPSAGAPDTPSRMPSPRPSPTEEPWEWDGPDGRPGWSSGFGGCHQASLPRRSTAPAPGLRFDVHVVVDAVRPGRPVFAIGSVTNTGDRQRQLHFATSAGSVSATLVARGRALSAVHWSDALTPHDLDLAPGESAGFEVRALTHACGDTSADPQPALPEGSYDLVVPLPWYADGRSGEWVSAVVPVRVAADAAEPPCGGDGTDCEYHPETLRHVRPDRAPAECGTEEWSGGDYGAGRGLTLSVRPDSARVAAGQPVAATVEVTNDGERPQWLLPLDPLGDGLLRSTGGPLGAGPGPSGSGDEVVGARYATERDLALPGPPQLVEPGGTILLPVRLATTTCDGTPLPVGEYRIRTGLYVAHWGWWAAPPATVTLTAEA